MDQKVIKQTCAVPTYRQYAQSLRTPSKRHARFVAFAIVLLHESNAENKDIALTERRSLGFSTAFQLGDGDGVCGPRIVGKCTAVLGVVVYQVEKDTTAADAVLRPVYHVLSFRQWVEMM